MGELHFVRPQWFWALVPMCGLLILLWKQRQIKGSWHSVCDSHLLPYVLRQAAPSKRMRALTLIGLAGFITVLALAGPVWQQLPQPVFKQQSALVVMLDLSRSMDATDVKPSRLDRARLKLLDLLNERADGQTALIAYAGDSFVVTPLTDDTDTIAALVQSMSTSLMPVQGSRAVRAVRRAIDLLKQAGVGSGALLMITDGVDHAEVEAVIDIVQETGHRLSVMGVGTSQGAPIPDTAGGFVKDRVGQVVIPKLDESPLRRLASETGGVYTPMKIQDDDIDQVLGNSAPDVITDSTEQTGFKTDRWREEGPWLVLVLLPIAMLAFRKGLLMIVVCLAIQWSDPALAADWKAWFLNPDQRGEQAMSDGDFGRAAREFEDPLWRASALYRNAEYEKALEYLDEAQGTESVYNRGNVLAKMGRIDEAIKSYEQVLTQQSDHDDARHNLEILKKLKEQQPPQPEQQDQESQSDQQDQQQGSSEQDQQSQSGSDQADEQQQGSAQQDQQSPSDQQDRQQDSSERDQQSQSGPGQDQQQPQAAGQDTDDQQKDSAAQNSDRETEDTEERSDQARGDGQHQSPSREEAEAESEAQTQQDRADAEEQRANEQWLRRVPDDPAGLLRRKFRYQYSRRYQNVEQEAQQW